MVEPAIDGQDPTDATDAQDDAGLMQALGAEVRTYIDERFAAIPEPPPPVIPQPPTPIVNVAPSNAEIAVNVPQQAAPVVNVETAAPIINVAPVGPTINVETAPPPIDFAPVVNVNVPEQQKPNVNVSVNQDAVVSALDRNSEAIRSADTNDQKRHAERMKQGNALLASIGALADALTAPKNIITDSSGKPIGLKVGK